jgi:hypothetical protein
MTTPRLFGHLLLWAGFLSAAFIVVRRTETPEDPWATINWAAYAVALAVAIAGVIQLRRTKKALRDDDETHAGNVDEMAASLQRLLLQLKAWQSPDEKPSVHDMHRQIDARLTGDLAAFAERRGSLVDAFGLEQYAQIMTEFALAERTINRMWSASADGYMDEVNACHERAIAQLEAAISRLEAARESKS